MTKKYIGVLAVVGIVAAGGFFLMRSNNNIATGPSAQMANVVAATASSTQGASTTALFSASPYAAHSYLISATSAYDAATLRALEGFQVKKKELSDGSLQITLIALQSEYPDQSYTVKPGEKLYFVEASSRDDSVSEDHAPADDRAILVGADGTIL